MNSSMKSDPLQQSVKVEQPIAGGAVVESPPASGRDPYEELADLMEVIESLCPKWPDRGTFRDSDVFLL